MKKVFQERWYQSEAAQAAFDSMKDESCNPVIVVPTAGGKTIIVCLLIDLILSENPVENILILSHDKRILRQNHEALEDFFEIEIGLYCQGLDSRTICKITVASIQSIYQKPKEFERFGKILVDECHLITMNQSGMYRRFLKSLGNHQVCGLTATDFRTNHGYIHKGEKALFNSVAYDLSSTENFNRLVSEGYLSQLFSKPTALKLEVSGLKTIAGDYSKKDMSENLDREELTEAAIIESVYFGKNYKRWLCFAIDIQHAEHIKERFLAHEIPAACVHSKSEDDDAEIINDFRNGKYRVLIGVGMLTTGFDIPDLDMIILMRPTKSQVLHVQMIGRGLRVVYANDFPIETDEERLAAIENGPKQHCLVLDFAGNVARLGPINHMDIKQKDKKGKGEAITKECPVCSMIHHGSAKVCENCGHEFVFKQLLELTSGNEDIVLKKKKMRIPDGEKTWVDVDAITYSRHHGKINEPDKIMAVYRCGLSIIKEPISINGKGYAKYIARNWINFRWDHSKGNPPPETVIGFLKNQHLLLKPEKILVDTRGQYPQVCEVVFHQRDLNEEQIYFADGDVAEEIKKEIEANEIMYVKNNFYFEDRTFPKNNFDFDDDSIPF